MIKLINLTYTIGNKNLFKNLNFQFSANKFILLGGDSGSGKSTLMRLMAGFANLTYTGNILIDGKDLYKQNMAIKASHIGMMFQVPHRQFTMQTLRKEIIFTLENLNRTKQQIDLSIKQVTKKIKIIDLLDRPLKYLSNGERQKAALSVVLAINPPILLLDEPFASIDAHSRKELIFLLKNLTKEGKTIILSDHDHTDYDNLIDQYMILKNGNIHNTDITLLKKNNHKYSLSKDTDKTDIFLNFHQVTYSASKQKCLLIQNDFQFKEGITTLTGDNGVGKSTLLRAISQRYKYKGKMFFYKELLKSRRKIYQKLSLAMQDSKKQFVTLTIKDELSFSNNQIKGIKQKQQEALYKLGLSDKTSLFQLSEGQKKMIQLISMLSLKLDFLMLDEPFSGLDQKSCDYFVNWIKEQSATQNFLIISHRLEPLYNISDHHIVFANQKLTYF